MTFPFILYSSWFKLVIWNYVSSMTSQTYSVAGGPPKMGVDPMFQTGEYYKKWWTLFTVQ